MWETEHVLRPAPSGSLPMLGDGKPPPHILTDSHDNPFTDGEIEARGLGFGASAPGPTYFLTLMPSFP